MIEPTKSDTPSGQPRTTSVRGSVFLSSVVVIIGVVVVALQLFLPRHDQSWLIRTIGWSVLLLYSTYNLVVEYRRPAGDARYMRVTTRWAGVASLIAWSAVTAWFVLHHVYGFSIKP